MPSMPLYGDSDIGKTMIVDKFVRDHPDICNPGSPGFWSAPPVDHFRMEIN
jgi:hypothetical protein